MDFFCAGHHKMITMSQFLCVIRLVLYTFASPNMSTTIWQGYFLLVQLIHGFNFALFWAAAVDAFVKLAPTGTYTPWSFYHYYIILYIDLLPDCTYHMSLGDDKHVQISLTAAWRHSTWSTSLVEEFSGILWSATHLTMGVGTWYIWPGQSVWLWHCSCLTENKQPLIMIWQRNLLTRV